MRCRRCCGVDPYARRTAAPGAATGLAQRLSGLGEVEQREVLLDLVRGQVAVVLGHEGADGGGSRPRVP